MRIAVIGSGVAGLGAAWLLDGSHEVLLFERDGRLGGHADTVELGSHPGEVVDLGTQHVSETMYPRVLAWFRYLDVPMSTAPVTATFYDAATRRVMPFSCQPSLVHMRRLCEPTSLVMLAALGVVQQQAHRLTALDDWSTTIEEMVERSNVPRFCKSEFVYPMLSAIAGATVDVTRSLSARAIFRFLIQHAPPHPFSPYLFKEVEGGLRAYVQRVAASFRTTTTLLGREVQTVRAAASDAKLLVTDARGVVHEVDRVVMAAPAHAARTMLADGPDGGLSAEVLARFSYMRTVIAVHEDPDLLPRDRRMWATANLVHGGPACEFTMVRDLRRGGPVFKSWITHARREPRRPLVIKEYRHPIMDSDYFRAQQALASRQGRHGIFFAGSYTQDIDSHESGLCSAIDAARAIDPELPKLRVLSVEPRRKPRITLDLGRRGASSARDLARPIVELATRTWLDMGR